VTVPSLTSSAKSLPSLLAARDERQESLARVLRAGRPATVFLSLNIPGGEKTPAGARALFTSFLSQLALVFPGSSPAYQALDALGPYAIISVDGDAVDAKRRCIVLETGDPAARLVDLDVYSAAGVQIDRRSLGLPARRCLVCALPAVDCMRSGRHPLAEVVARSHELLSPFRT
jgi:holo-ACP synthase